MMPLPAMDVGCESRSNLMTALDLGWCIKNGSLFMCASPESVARRLICTPADSSSGLFQRVVQAGSREW